MRRLIAHVMMQLMAQAGRGGLRATYHKPASLFEYLSPHHSIHTGTVPVRWQLELEFGGGFFFLFFCLDVQAVSYDCICV